MGEEEKKAEEAVKMEEKKTEEEPKKEEGGGEQVKKEEVKAAKVSDEKKKEDGESAKAATAPPPPPPPQEIVLRVFMHCEGCARKVRRCLKGFPGVEEVQTDCKSQKVVVKGAKADPVKVHERVQRKSHRKVDLISPIPKPPPAEEEPKKVEDKQIPKPQDKKEEAPVIMVVLKVHMHCEACAQEIKKRILRMKGVESADADLKGSQVTVKGVFEAPKLVEYVYKRTGKHAVIVKQEPEKKDDYKGKDDKKGEEGGGEKDAKKDDKAADGGAGEGKEKKEGGGQEAPKPEAAVAGGGGGEQGETVMEMKKNEFYYYHHPQNYQIYPPRFATDQMYSSSSNPYSYPAHAPQMFSDENPNACSVM